MIKKHKNLEGFTLYETLIGMVLSMLVIGLCYSIFTITVKLEKHLRVQENNILQRNRLLLQIKHNFFNSEKILHDHSSFFVFSDSLEMEVTDSLIVFHKTYGSDTIRLSSEKIQLFMEKEHNLELINKMELYCLIGHEAYLVYLFQKEYPAKILYDLNNSHYGAANK